MSYKLVCFDMDGVLYSSEKMIARVFHDAGIEYARESGLDIIAPPLPVIIEQIGKPIKTIFHTLYPYLSEKERQEISLFILDSLVAAVRAGEGVLLPGARHVLSQLSEDGVFLGLASNGRASYLDAILETYALSPFFPDRAVIDGVQLPDKSSLIVHSMDRYSVTAGETLMVGDRIADYEAARKAGVDFACVVSGHGNDFTTEVFEYGIDHLEDLIPVVLGRKNAGL